MTYTSWGIQTDINGVGGFDPSTPAIAAGGDYVFVEVCHNTVLTDVRISGSVEVANIEVDPLTVDQLPAGIVGNWNAATRVFTINGTPTLPVPAGNPFTDYDLIIKGSGSSCTPIGNINLKIRIYPTDTIILAAGSNANELVCDGTLLTNVIYNVGGGALGAAVTGLPTGLRGDFTAPNIFTISGTPNVSITETTSYTYTITTSGNNANNSPNITHKLVLQQQLLLVL